MNQLKLLTVQTLFNKKKNLKNNKIFLLKIKQIMRIKQT